jgi:hypothetical protein
MKLLENIGRVLSNLDRTIAGKEILLAELEAKAELAPCVDDRFAAKISAKFVKINLDELRRIRDDLQA